MLAVSGGQKDDQQVHLANVLGDTDQGRETALLSLGLLSRLA